MQGKVCWKSPSNLAIIKYWGKFGRQLPRNPSISFTLDAAHSLTEVEYASKPDIDKCKVSFHFDGTANQAFGDRVERFINDISDLAPWMQGKSLIINSSNSFPHSSGIASSASGLSAMALCICSIGQRSDSKLNDKTYFLNYASTLARLGSGSASRSVYPYLAVWGETEHVKDSSNEHAIAFDKVDPIFKTYHDDILIVSRTEKSVSSTAGHALMDNNVYADSRYQQAKDRLKELLICLQNGNLDKFGTIAEDEALSLHALMMCSDPSYILMEAESLNIIQKIRAYRKETGLPLHFSLDAGPNIHLLYPDQIKDQVKPFIESELIPHCVDGLVIEDKVGEGPVLISHEY